MTGIEPHNELPVEPVVLSPDECRLLWHGPIRAWLASGMPGRTWRIALAETPAT